MPTTILKIVEQTFHEVAGATSQERAGIYFYQIEAFLADALRTLQRQALQGIPSVRQYCTKAYALVPTAGLFDLSAHTDLLVESLPLATLTHADSEFPLQYCPNPGDLIYPQPGLDFIYYSVEGATLRTRDTGGVLDSLTTNITVRDGVYRPVVSDVALSTTLKPQLEDALVMILKEMVLQKLRGGAPQPQGAQ